MTREEVIEYLTILGGIGGITDNEARALEIAIEALEQESAIDKIRAEIEQVEIVYDKSPDYKDNRTDAEKAADQWKMDKLLVLGIIDKYKAESEEV